MAKKIQPKLSRPRAAVVFDAACAAAFDRARHVLNCLALAKSGHTLRPAAEYVQRANEHAAELRDFAALAGDPFSPEWFLRSCAEAKENAGLVDEAVALAARRAAA